MAGISFSKEGLSGASSSFNEIGSNIITEIGKIQADLQIIESNWSGPQHDVASADRDSAEKNLQDAKNSITNMDEALGKLSENAGKVEY